MKSKGIRVNMAMKILMISFRRIRNRALCASPAPSAVTLPPPPRAVKVFGADTDYAVVAAAASC